jgi:hypothetical protein
LLRLRRSRHSNKLWPGACGGGQLATKRISNRASTQLYWCRSICGTTSHRLLQDRRAAAAPQSLRMHTSPAPEGLLCADAMTELESQIRDSFRAVFSASTSHRPTAERRVMARPLCFEDRVDADENEASDSRRHHTSATIKYCIIRDPSTSMTELESRSAILFRAVFSASTSHRPTAERRVMAPPLLLRATFAASVFNTHASSPTFSANPIERILHPSPKN